MAFTSSLRRNHCCLGVISELAPLLNVFCVGVSAQRHSLCLCFKQNLVLISIIKKGDGVSIKLSS